MSTSSILRSAALLARHFKSDVQHTHIYRIYSDKPTWPQMSFKATMVGAERQVLWTRTINVLAAVNENIKFTVTSEEVIIWTANKTETTSCKVRFAKNFFDIFEFNPQEIVFGEDGVQLITDRQGREHSLYTFGVNGSYLGALTKKSEGDSLKSLTLAINNTTTCPDFLTNRLLVYIEMDSLICKQHSLQMEPLKYDPFIVDIRYKNKFLEVYGQSSEDVMVDPKLVDIFRAAEEDVNAALFYEERGGLKKRKQLTIADEINYICCNQTLLKNFIDNCNPNHTRELKLEINTSKLSLTAFSHAIYGKNNSVLKNALSFTDTISTLDLEHYCIFTTYEEELDGKETETEHTSHRRDQTKSVIFNLADFKKYMNIVSTWKNDSESNVNVWFCHRGSPILFEVKKLDVVLELTQITFMDGTLGNNEMSSATVVDHKPLKRIISPEKVKIHDNPKKEIGLPRLSPSKPPYSPKPSRVSPLKEDKLPSPGVRGKRKLFVNDSSENESFHENKRSNPWKDSLTAVEETNNSCHRVDNDDEGNETTILGPVPAERSSTTVGWGTRINETKDDPSKIDEQALLKREKLKHFEQLKQEQENIQIDFCNDDEGFGPTPLPREKGLFD